MPATTVKEPSSRFAIAHSELLSARAALDQLCAQNPEGDPDDAPLNDALIALNSAEWRLAQTPARKFAEIQERARVVLEMFTQSASAGSPTDNRDMLMLSALVSEILKYMPEASADSAELKH
jgi:hypothetical protein